MFMQKSHHCSKKDMLKLLFTDSNNFILMFCTNGLSKSVNRRVYNCDKRVKRGIVIPLS